MDTGRVEGKTKAETGKRGIVMCLLLPFIISQRPSHEFECE